MRFDVEATTVSGAWWRHIPGGGRPAYRPQPPSDNRWQRGTVVDALYLSGDRDGMWAEWYRHLAELGIPPTETLPRDVWEYNVATLTVADLSTEERLDGVDLSPPSPDRKEWRRFQRVGEKLHAQGFSGLVTISAARRQSLVLAVFLGSGLPEGLTAVKHTRVDAVPPPPRGMVT
ncbi:RES domain-containing protein [Tomitella gaofuii]|uniref:RES domain-containing protein n=1 Tax=Tomitella gaofuii TaxID=2760083 RepID=UPI0015F7A071|nr:RES domain-containing protein [Tomitella gaofuii]